MKTKSLIISLILIALASSIASSIYFGLKLNRQIEFENKLNYCLAYSKWNALDTIDLKNSKSINCLIEHLGLTFDDAWELATFASQELGLYYLMKGGVN